METINWLQQYRAPTARVMKGRMTEEWWWVVRKGYRVELERVRKMREEGKSAVGSEESWSVRGRLQTWAYLSAWVCVNTSAV